ncbi:MAG TPA: xanthine dehydrogenase family protein subunit M [Candidatus Limnocylindrales bacterium]|jgi:carbon-monoxide dehydrogenase medium subunit|nr:xanthine dehydrogenase family protein subunit M [Candidatus Limnocylindrales bacterium]
MKRTEPFEFYQPATLEEARRLVSENGPGGRFLAGGTDLVIAMKEKGLLPKYIVDLKRVPGLAGIRENSDGTITLGALTTMREIEISRLITKKYPFLSQSAAEVGSIQIRNRATIGGNMSNATPSADTAPALIALNATAKIAGATGERSINLEEFFKGPGQTVMSAEEILTEVSIPKTGPRLVGEYIKFSPREMMDLAYVGVAVAYNLGEKDKKCDGVRIVLGAVAPTPIRAKRAEAALEGQILTEELAEKIGAIAAEEAKPISDVRSTAEYRRAMVGAMTKRALLNAAVGPAKTWVERRERRY